MHKPLEITPKKEEKEGIFDWIQLVYHVVFIVLMVIILYIAVSGGSATGSYDWALQDFQFNWRMSPIVNIAAADGSVCPDDFDSLITRQWPGTVAGCDCRKITSKDYEKKLLKETCTPEHLKAGCKNVPAVRAYKLESFYSTKLCVQRAGDDFVNILRPQSMQGGALACDAAHKVCGAGDVDNTVCVLNDIPCPINDIYMARAADPKKVGDRYVNLTNGLQLRFGTNGKSLPISRFKLTENKVCADPFMLSKNDGRKLYPLLDSTLYDTCTEKIGTSVYDSRYDLVGSIQEDRLFNDNGLSAVLPTLPEYNTKEGANITWNLYSNEYHSWKTECDRKTHLSRTRFMDIITEGLLVPFLQFILIIFCIIQFVVFCLFLEPIAILKLFMKPCCALPYTCCQVFNFGLKMISAVITGYFFWQAISATDDFDDEIWEMSNSNCSDAYGHSILEGYGHGLSSSLRRNWIGLVLTVVAAVLTIVFFFRSMRTKNSYTSF